MSPITPGCARHMIELESFAATGRALLASRMAVRTRLEPL
jgi:hypothetical protein